jgi:hypothetical protein
VEVTLELGRVQWIVTGVPVWSRPGGELKLFSGPRPIKFQTVSWKNMQFRQR